MVRRNLWWCYGAFILAVMVFDITTGKVDSNFDPSTFIATIAPMVAVAAGIWIWRPDNLLAWCMWLLGWVAVAVGNTMALSHWPPEATTPSIRDLFYLGQYVYQGLGILLLTWSREARKDVVATLGACVIVIGITALTFGPTLVDVTEDPGTTLFKGQQLAYIVAEGFLFVAAVRLFMSVGHRSPAFWFVIVMGALIAAGNFTENEMQAVYASGGEPDFGGGAFISLRYVPTLLVYALGGMAALHPSMRDLGSYARPGPYRWRYWREAPIALCTFIPLVVTGYHGTSPLLRLSGWLAVAVLIIRYWTIFHIFVLMRGKLENGKADREGEAQ